MSYQQVLLSVIAIAALSGCAGIQKPAPTNKVADQVDFPIIDAHLHAYMDNKKDELSGIMNDKTELLKEMKEAGVVGAVSHARVGEKNVADLREHHVIHCAGLGAKVDEKALEEGLRTQRFRCMKIYLGYIEQYAYSKNYEPAYRLAEKYGVPVVFHTGDTSDSDAMLKYSDPLTIDEVAVRHRKVNFVIAHLGNPWVNSAAEVVYKNANVYADVSAFLIGDLNETDPAQVEEYVEKPIRWAFGYIEDSKKLMYGTDWPLTYMKPYRDAVLRAIPREHWKDVFYNNALRVFKIPGLMPATEEMKIRTAENKSPH